MNRAFGFESRGSEEEMVDSMLSSSSSSEADSEVFYEPSYAALQSSDMSMPWNLDVNVTSFQDVVTLFNINVNFTLFLLSLICAISWIVYITFYSSRVTGVVLTKIANRFVKVGCVKIGKFTASLLQGSRKLTNIRCCGYVEYFGLTLKLDITGSLSISVLSGKVMFRDVAYITEDFSLRVQDGWVIFRWWRAYVPKDISEGELTVFYILRLETFIMF